MVYGINVNIKHLPGSCTSYVLESLFGLFCGVLKRSLIISLLVLSCLSMCAFFVYGTDSVNCTLGCLYIVLESYTKICGHIPSLFKKQTSMSRIDAACSPTCASCDSLGVCESEKCFKEPLHRRMTHFFCPKHSFSSLMVC